MTRFEVRKGGKTYYQCEMFQPPAKALLLKQIEAGYTPYANGRKVTKASLQPRKNKGAAP